MHLIIIFLLSFYANTIHASIIPAASHSTGIASAASQQAKTQNAIAGGFLVNKGSIVTSNTVSTLPIVHLSYITNLGVDVIPFDINASLADQLAAAALYYDSIADMQAADQNAGFPLSQGVAAVVPFIVADERIRNFVQVGCVGYQNQAGFVIPANFFQINGRTQGFNLQAALEDEFIDRNRFNNFVHLIRLSGAPLVGTEKSALSHPDFLPAFQSAYTQIRTNIYQETWKTFKTKINFTNVGALARYRLQIYDAAFIRAAQYGQKYYLLLSDAMEQGVLNCPHDRAANDHDKQENFNAALQSFKNTLPAEYREACFDRVCTLLAWIRPSYIFEFIVHDPRNAQSPRNLTNAVRRRDLLMPANDLAAIHALMNEAIQDSTLSLEEAMRAVRVIFAPFNLLPAKTIMLERGIANPNTLRDAKISLKKLLPTINFPNDKPELHPWVDTLSIETERLRSFDPKLQLIAQILGIKTLKNIDRDLKAYGIKERNRSILLLRTSIEEIHFLSYAVGPHVPIYQGVLLQFRRMLTAFNNHGGNVDYTRLQAHAPRPQLNIGNLMDGVTLENIFEDGHYLRVLLAVAQQLEPALAIELDEWAKVLLMPTYATTPFENIPRRLEYLTNLRQNQANVGLLDQANVPALIAFTKLLKSVGLFTAQELQVVDPFLQRADQAAIAGGILQIAQPLPGNRPQNHVPLPNAAPLPQSLHTLTYAERDAFLRALVVCVLNDIATNF